MHAKFAQNHMHISCKMRSNLPSNHQNETNLVAKWPYGTESTLDLRENLATIALYEGRILTQNPIE